MNNTSFAEILDGLEKDVFDLVSNFERQINSRLASAGSGARVAATSAPAKPFQPKWKGLRSVLRWLWKGHSKDNPDYAHMYGGKQAKNESKNGRPTLAEYLHEVRTIDGFADEICVEILGGVLSESSANFSDLIGRFKMDFRNIVLKYKNLVKDSAPPAPEVAPSASGQQPVSPNPEVQNSNRTAPEQPSEKDNNSEPEMAAAQEERPQDKEEAPPAAQVDQEEKDDSPKVGASASEEAASARKSKSHSANIGRWFKEALEAKKNDSVNPNEEWLNSKGIVRPEKLPWVIAWMGKKSHKDLHKDEDVRSELKAAIGSSFQDFVPKIAKKESDSLVAYLRTNMPMVSDEEFKKLVSELYGSEYDGPGVSSEKKKKEKKERSGQTVAADKADGEESKKEPDIQELRLKTLSSLYDGMDNKEKILNSVEDKVVEPVYDRIESDEDAEYFGNWWKSFKRERLGDDQETAESLIARIDSGAMFDDILRNSEVSKKKPEKKIQLRTLMDLLKGS